MYTLLFVLAAARGPAEVRLIVEAAPGEVLLANPSPAPTLFSVHGRSPGAPDVSIPLLPGTWTALPLPPGVDPAAFVFDYATPEGRVALNAPFLAAPGLSRRTLVLFDRENATLSFEASETNVEAAAEIDGSGSFMTIGPPPRRAAHPGADGGLLFPNGSYRPKPALEPAPGCHSPF